MFAGWRTQRRWLRTRRAAEHISSAATSPELCHAPHNSGYKALFASGVTEAGCLAHAKRKFHELWVNHKSAVGEQALALFVKLYDVEREVADLDAERRRCIRREKARPIADALHKWLAAQRQKVPPGSATAKAIDYTLGRWPALTRYIDDGDLPADNSWVENQIRPIAIGRSNWLFAGSLRAGKRAAAVMSLIDRPSALRRDGTPQPPERLDHLQDLCGMNAVQIDGHPVGQARLQTDLSSGGGIPTGRRHWRRQYRHRHEC